MNFLLASLLVASAQAAHFNLLRDDCPAPPICQDTELTCPTYTPPDAACPNNPLCKPKNYKCVDGIHSEIFCKGFCDPIFNPEYQKLCPGPVEEPHSIPTPGTVVQMKSPDANGKLTCETPCPTNCASSDMPCDDAPDPNCPTIVHQSCHPKKVPGSSSVVMCNNFCPMHCNEDEHYCPGPEDEYGCRTSPGSCITRNVPDVNGELTCHNPCPTVCSEDEMPCTQPSNSNCPYTITLMCHPKKVNSSEYPEVDCPNVCPPPYNMDDQKMCPGPPQESGCPTAGTVVAITDDCPMY